MTIQFELKKTVLVNVKFIEVIAKVGYWEDATVNGSEDERGDIPLRKNDCWTPVIDLTTGTVKNWPQGVIADVHYKICDQGEYWLQDDQGTRVAKWEGHYVPDDILCIGGQGYGDYIIMNIGIDGKIDYWKNPILNSHEWIAA